MYKTPRGFRDLGPRETLVMEGIMDTMLRIFKKYGFDPIETPVLEKWETLQGKQGTEEKLIFKFTDELSGREYALRYDLTVPLARFFSNSSYPLPFKRYQVGRSWRHDRPQKGRFREFRQADVDIVGSPYPEADAEIITIVQEVMECLGFRNYEILLNERRILGGIFKEEFGIDDPLPLYRIIDEKEKRGIEKVRENLYKHIDDEQEVQSIVELLSQERDNPFELLEWIEERYSGKICNEGVSHLKRIFELVGGNNHVFFRLDLVRGLDYYTGPVWEVKLEDAEEVGSVAAGGRYDNLLAVYGREAKATGGSFGIDRLIEAGVDLGIFDVERETETEVYIVSFGEKLYDTSWKLASRLRKAGFTVQTDLRRRSIGSQLDYTKSKGIPVVLFLGPKELKKGIVTIYMEKTDQRLEIERDKIESKLEEILHG
ncbi:MAG: histidine--tRNA ligase [Candidatus Korarchaeota archaeon]|nr:histidine--tRNA ligase [Candidatus Korarchaeota archaeon]NIU85494.1 histidine--tRNA ligase [Candidatus Thorarchaeota archaeon]NIW15611.1 histidine--tRNA ligase [Candidatus Thorarchaeota archaeon]NIW53542.1 histidine--tRNA ligase [Candidatus Korarchaeota archaeon]